MQDWRDDEDVEDDVQGYPSNRVTIDDIVACSSELTQYVSDNYLNIHIVNLEDFVSMLQAC